MFAVVDSRGQGQWVNKSMALTGGECNNQAFDGKQ